MCRVWREPRLSLRRDVNLPGPPVRTLVFVGAFALLDTPGSKWAVVYYFSKDIACTALVVILCLLQLYLGCLSVNGTQMQHKKDNKLSLDAWAESLQAHTSRKS